MNAFKIRISRIIPGFHESIKSRLHQGADTTAQHGLLTKQIRFRLGTECGLQQSGSCAAHRCAIGKCQLQGMTGCILLHCDQHRGSLSCLIL